MWQIVPRAMHFRFCRNVMLSYTSGELSNEGRQDSYVVVNLNNNNNNNNNYNKRTEHETSATKPIMPTKKMSV